MNRFLIQPIDLGFGKMAAKVGLAWAAKEVFNDETLTLIVTFFTDTDEMIRFVDFSVSTIEYMAMASNKVARITAFLAQNNIIADIQVN